MGTFLWIAQRVSSLIILSYVLLILISYFIKPYQYDASIWYFDIHTITMKVFTSAFLIVLERGSKQLKMIILQNAQ